MKRSRLQHQKHTWQWVVVAEGRIAADFVFILVEVVGVEVLEDTAVVELAASLVCCGNTTVITLNIEEFVESQKGPGDQQQFHGKIPLQRRAKIHTSEELGL
ncbi:hypothetical protein CEXT_258491 [Caerostris extrusa]|uniref:Uncharacterized protein n=1 Tax=Caerostris extrusa TaxID=172846 RepID=A0AAV4R7T8_CAEEX|nr:hypothetical protein CEXT_258491 [Caerostris extrusa]